MARKMAALEQSISEVREEGRKAVEAVRQAVATKAGLSDLEVKEGAKKRVLFVADETTASSFLLFPERLLFTVSVAFRSPKP